MMIMKNLSRLTVLFLATVALGLVFVPAFGQSNSDWFRRQQQQQQQQQRQLEQQRQQQQRQQQQEQMRQQMRDQMRQQMQQQQRQQMQQQMRQQQQLQMRQQQQGRLSSGVSSKGSVQHRAGKAPFIVSTRSDQVVYSNGVAKITRPLTAGEIRRGFTGKLTSDGRALVKINGRVVAVPSARAGVRANSLPRTGASQRLNWSASKRAMISADVRTLASANLKNKGRIGGGGRKPPGGPGGGGDEPPRRVAANENNPRARAISGFLTRNEATIRAGLDVRKKEYGYEHGYRNMPGGTQAAKDIFKSVTGHEPFRQRETFTITDKSGKKLKTITYRPAENSKSKMPKIDINHHDLKIYEKISFVP